MATKKITDFTELTSPADGDLFEIVDVSDTSEAPTGTNKKIAYSNISIADASTTVKGKVELATTAETETGTDPDKAVTPDAYRDAFATTNAAIIHAATEKTTPADADELGLVDSAASFVLKRLTWANVKATLLTWLRLSTTIIPVNAPQGFLINGKLSVTDAAGITVAIKTLAGADPSATDPVYCRIGDTVRSITSALSVSKADGTNWCNAGSAELATKEIDYFVYLGYNATDGVVIGFSRFPGANQYSNFSATTTNEKYCAISTITTAASTDYYEVIGRFAATLSAGAGYTWSVPTYTAANLIQRPIYETRWLRWVPTLAASGGTPPTYTLEFLNIYKVSGDKVEYSCEWENTSGGTAGSGAVDLYTSLPFSVSTSLTAQTNRGCIGHGQTNASITNSLTILRRDANTFACCIPAGTNMLASGQAATSRFVSINGQYPI